MAVGRKAAIHVPEPCGAGTPFPACPARSGNGHAAREIPERLVDVEDPDEAVPVDDGDAAPAPPPPGPPQPLPGVVITGDARAGATTGGAGQIKSKSLESSTVDLATEFTNLITTQRAYAASSKIVTTASTMLDQLLQVVR